MARMPALRFRLPAVFLLVVVLGLIATAVQSLKQLEVDRANQQCWRARVQFETALGMEVAPIMRCEPREIPITADVMALTELGLYWFEPIFKYVCPAGSDGGGFKYFRFEGNDVVCVLHGRRNQPPKDPPGPVPAPPREPLPRALMEAIEQRADVRHLVWTNYYNRRREYKTADGHGNPSVSDVLDLVGRRAAELDAMARALP